MFIDVTGILEHFLYLPTALVAGQNELQALAGGMFTEQELLLLG